MVKLWEYNCAYDKLQYIQNKIQARILSNDVYILAYAWNYMGGMHPMLNLCTKVPLLGHDLMCLDKNMSCTYQ